MSPINNNFLFWFFIIIFIITFFISLVYILIEIFRKDKFNCNFFCKKCNLFINNFIQNNDNIDKNREMKDINSKNSEEKQNNLYEERELAIIDNRNNEEKKVEEDKKENKDEKKDDLTSPLIIYEKKQYGKTFICIIFNLDNNLIFGITFLGRIIMTIYSFHGLFFLYNFIIQYLTIIPVKLFEVNSKIKIIYGLLYICFSILTSNVLVIPTFEFFSFPFLNYNDPLSHFYSLKNFIDNELSEENVKFESDKIVSNNNNWANCIFIIIELLYSISYILGLLSFTTLFQDFVEIIIISCIYIYYLMIFFAYFIISIYSFIICYEFKNTKVPDINLLSYSINHKYKQNYKINIIDNKRAKNPFIFNLRNILRFLFIIFSFLILICSENRLNVAILFLYSLIFLSISITLDFPFCYRNMKTDNGFFISSLELLDNDKSKHHHPFLVSALRFLCDLIFFLVSTILVISLFFAEEKSEEDYADYKKFSQITKINEPTDYNKLLLPSICRSTIYDLPIYKYIPFMNDAYYYNENKENKTSFNYSSYKNIFFEEENLEINTIGNLVQNKNNENTEKVKMIQYNVKSPYNNITILAIKGTSHRKDIFLDLQLYIPSVFLNLLSTFSIFSQETDSYSFKIIEYALSIPYRLFSKHLFINTYINDLREAYDNIVEPYDNIVIVGHSLGGGLSKILSKIVKKQSISLSGPGINAFHSNWTEQGNSENFDISMIDLVPDMDLVPRVEISGGTIYRIICNKGPFKCHNKAISLCETLIMCRNPYRNSYCFQMAKLERKDIEKVMEKSELNKKINEINK